MLGMTLPVIEGWPYQRMKHELLDFKEAHGKNPAILWVGKSLWKLLRKTLDDVDFYADNMIPIHVDRTGILEPNESMFTR